MRKFLLPLILLMGLGLGACTTQAKTNSTSTDNTSIVEPSDSGEGESTTEENSESEGETESGGSEGDNSSTEEGGGEVTVNDGSLEHPFTVSEGYAIAETLGANEDAGAQYFTTGTVTGEISFYKGRLSFDFTDGVHTLRVYNMNNEENKASYKQDEINFTEGDTLIVAGTYKNYVKDDVSTLEICYVKDVADCYRAG